MHNNKCEGVSLSRSLIILFGLALFYNVMIFTRRIYHQENLFFSKRSLCNFFFFFFRLIESDAKSLNSLQSNHSRKSSDTSQISLTSGGSGNGGDPGPRRNTEDGEENVWTLWGHIVTDWENQWKKRKDFIKELVRQGVPHHFRYRYFIIKVLKTIEIDGMQHIYFPYKHLDLCDIQLIENISYKL